MVKLTVSTEFIESGRHKKPALPQEQRLCQFCKNGQIEDEFHFMLKCEKYSVLRTSLFSAIDLIDISNINNEE
jgi:hypothetical protein